MCFIKWIYFTCCSATYCGMYAITVWTHWPEQEKKREILKDINHPDTKSCNSDCIWVATEVSWFMMSLQSFKRHFRHVQSFLKSFRNRWIQWTCSSFLYLFVLALWVLALGESTQETSEWWILQIFSFLWSSRIWNCQEEEKTQQLLINFFLRLQK